MPVRCLLKAVRGVEDTCLGESVALNLQEMLGRLFRVGFEGGILILFGEIIVGWPLYAAVLYFIFSRCGFFISDNDNKSLSLFR